MKKIIYTLSLLLFFTSFANAGIDDYIKIKDKNGKVSFDSTSINKTINDSAKSLQNDLTKRLNEEIDKLSNRFNEETDKLSQKFDGEVKKITEKVDKNIIQKGGKIVDRAQKEFDNLIVLKNKAVHYAIIGGIVFGIIFVLFLLVVLFLVWRSYKKITKFSPENIFGNTENIKKILKKLDELEKKIDKLSK